jgi:D-3-phosphoglycerate dehydrogenase
LKVLHLESNRYSADALQQLRTNTELVCLNINNQRGLISHLKDNQYDAIITRLGLMLDKEVLETQSDIKFIISATTGLNHIDQNYCIEKSIEIISLKGENAFLSTIKSTAEHTWLLLLALARNFPASYYSVKSGLWQREPFMADELDGRVLGIIGFGRLGKILSGYANSFGMRILVHDILTIDEKAYPHVKQTNVEQLLGESDFVSLLISYSPEMEGYMSKEKFNMMKKGAYFVNTSRGELIDEIALCEALESRHLEGAAVDVLSGDSGWSASVLDTNPLIAYEKTHKGLIITPHMGGYGKESIIRTRDFVVNKFLDNFKKI